MNEEPTDRSVAEARTVVSERREMKTVRDHGAVIGVKRKPRKVHRESVPSCIGLRPGETGAGKEDNVI